MQNNTSLKVPLCVIVLAKFHSLQSDRCLMWFNQHAKFAKVVTEAPAKLQSHWEPFAIKHLHFYLPLIFDK